MTGLYCKCGHRAEVHQYLPGHPDNAMKCNGSKRCQCGKFRADPMRGAMKPLRKRAVMPWDGKLPT